MTRSGSGQSPAAVIPRRRRLCALAVVLVLVIAGCGRRSTGGPEGSTAGSAGTTAGSARNAAGSAAAPPRDVRGTCEKATRNYATLVYWQRADAEIAKLPPEQRDADRKRRLAALTHELETQMDFFVDQCISANNDAQIDCMIAAKTGAEALQCADLLEPD